MPLDTETPYHQRSLRLGPNGTRLEQGHLDLGDGRTGPASASDDPEIEPAKPERSDDPRQGELGLGDKSNSGEVIPLPCDLEISPPCDCPQ